MAYGAQGAQDPYAADYTEMERRLALREQTQKRQALESLAAQGALTGGARQAREQEVSAGIGELWHSGAQAIESRRFAANEANTQREWQTGERQGSEAATAALQQNQIEAQEAMQNNQITQDQWSQLNANQQEELMAGTNARYASQLSAQEAGQTGALSAQEAAQQSALSAQGATQQLTQTGAEFGYSQTLQTQAEEARSALQTQVDAGQMTLQDAQNTWAGVQADLQRQQELTVQGTAIVQEQWMAQFGQAGALALQEHQQVFEQAMTDLARQWEIDDRPWDAEQWLKDAQLQMTVAGWNWNDDDVSGGVPAWIAGVETPEGVSGTALTGTQGVSAGSTSSTPSGQYVFFRGKYLPVEAARRMGYTG